MIQQRLSQIITITCLLAVSLIVLAGCGNSEPILIGFAGELTGKRAELGVDARDGAQLAVETINQAGGIDGRQINFVVKNDEGVPETAQKVNQELIDQGVVGLIGHITSGQMAAVFDQINQAKLTVVSPTASSMEFSDQDDYFFRVLPTNDFMGQALANYIYNGQNVKKIVVVYDLGNIAYTEGLWQALSAQFETLGGDSPQAITFTSGETDLTEIVNQLDEMDVEGIVFIASAVDTALMAQYARDKGIELPLFSVPWAQTDELLKKGGQAVEGMFFSALYDPDNSFPAFAEFTKKFEERYHRPPTFPAAYAYEAVLVLADGLKRTNGQAEGLPEALKQVKNLEGAQSKISLDEYGDVSRNIYISTVKGGKYVVIDQVSAD